MTENSFKFFQVYDRDKNIESLIKTTQLGQWIKTVRG